MVEQAAASIIDQSTLQRSSERIYTKKVGSTAFFASLLRILSNKLLVFTIISSSLIITSLLNFMFNENIFLESRFYAPKPTGLFFGFGDPILTRIFISQYLFSATNFSKIYLQNNILFFLFFFSYHTTNINWFNCNYFWICYCKI